MQCDKKSLFVVADASKKRNLMVVGGYADNVVDLCGEDNADVKAMPRSGTHYTDEGTESS